MRSLAAEAFGTFALVFAGTGAIVVNDVHGGAVSHVGVALTFGLVVLAMIYALGDVSGAHLNPAVTLGFFAARRFPARSVAPMSRSASSSGTGRLHLGEQRGRPAAAAEDHVGHDTVIAHRQYVQVVPGVRHAVLGPAERVLDHLGRPALDGVPAQLVEAGRVGEPARVLWPLRLAPRSHPSVNDLGDNGGMPSTGLLPGNLPRQLTSFMQEATLLLKASRPFHAM